MLVNLSSQQLDKKVNFIKDYMNKSNNASSSSYLDANANVSIKNMATLNAEINKDINIQVNRRLAYDKIKEIFNEDLAKEYIRQIESHEIYIHDESHILPYCAAINMYSFLLEGLKTLGGDSEAPKHLSSYCGGIVNLVFAVASQFAGAVATVEFLLYFDHFAKKEFGENYTETNPIETAQWIQHVVYALNQPASARGYQSVFWNISIFDENYFNGLFKDFYFPDGKKAEWKSLDKLQKFFLTWFNKERTKAILTFPVLTVAVQTENKRIKSEEYRELISKEFSEGNSFFIYASDSVDSLSSCCRLRNPINDLSFSYTLGGTGLDTGSLKVITLNMNRLIQDETVNKRNLKDEVIKIQKYQVAHRQIFEEFSNADLMTVYKAGFISLDKQYLTLGVNGLVEGAEFLGYKISNNKEYKDFLKKTLKTIYDLNREATAKYKYKFNTEFVPAENLGAKNYKWDKKAGYIVPEGRNCYNSYMYVVEDKTITFIDKANLHGEEIIKYLDGGSAFHWNIEEELTYKQWLLAIDLIIATGCNYFTKNLPETICNDCNNIDKRYLRVCSKCGSNNLDYATRIIGYLKRISSFSLERKIETSKRYYEHLKE